VHNTRAMTVSGSGAIETRYETCRLHIRCELSRRRDDAVTIIRKEPFAEVSKSLARYSSENNFI